jgi:hypothetical protein
MTVPLSSSVKATIKARLFARPQAGATPARGAPLTSYCGCCGAVAGGVGVGPSVGVEVGKRYQTRINPSTTATAMMSALFVSMLFQLPAVFSPTIASFLALKQAKLIRRPSDEDHNGPHTITATLAKPAHTADP